MEKKEPKKYEKPVMEVVNVNDIITTSTDESTPEACCDGRCDTFG